MKGIVFATGNKGKAEEAQAILNIPIEVVELELDEVQSLDVEYVARKKADEAFRLLGRPVLVDDVGVFIDAWNGFPGPFAKFILDRLGNRRILEILKNEKNRGVKVRSAIGFHNGTDVHVFVGEVNGTIAHEERGTEGWGFDPIIIPEGQTQTYAEMGLEGKNKISHRRKAFDKLKEFLDSQEKEKGI